MSSPILLSIGKKSTTNKQNSICGSSIMFTAQRENNKNFIFEPLNDNLFDSTIQSIHANGEVS